MWNRGGRSFALDRAQALLSVKRNTKSAADVAEQSGSKGPTAKAPGHTGALGGKNRSADTHTSFPDLSDLSSLSSVGDHGEGTVGSAAAGKCHGGERDSSQDPRPQTSLGGGGLRFLKKAPPPAVTSSHSPTISKTQVQQPPEARYVSSSRRGSESAALSRLALIEDRIRSRKTQRQAKEEPKPAQKIISSPGISPCPPASQSLEAPLPLSAGSSSDLSPKGQRFLKKSGAADSSTAATAAVPAKGQGHSVKTPTTAILFDRSRAASASATVAGLKTVRAVTSVNLDSDEEDMRKLLGDSLDSTDDSLLRPERTSSMRAAGKVLTERSQKVSPSPPAEGRPLSSSKRASSRSSASPPHRRSPFRFSGQAHVQFSPSVLSLSPSPPGRPRSSLRTESPPRSLSSISGHSEVLSLEELFPAVRGSEDSHSERSLVSSEAGEQDFKINIMSLDDLAPVTFGLTEETTGEERETKPSKHKAPASGNLTGDQQLPGEKEKKKKKKEEEEEELVVDYQSDFESESRTETNYSASQVSEHLGGHREEDEIISTAGEEASRSDRSHGRTEDDYSSSFSDTSRSYATRSSGHSPTSRSLSRSRDSRSLASHGDRSSSCQSRRRSLPDRASKEAAVQTQPDLLTYAWSAGMAALDPTVGVAFTDPTPVASHTVSAETVEALTTYSPAVFALNDMLRQQLTLTRQFIQSSRRLHSSLVQSLGPADYTYTTLEDTNEFIRRHKPPKLTVEEALEEVLQEMRDYHYI